MVTSGAELADDFGIESVSLAALAGRLGVKAPALRSSFSPAKSRNVGPSATRRGAQLFGEWRSSDEVCEIRKSEPLYVANAKIPKNVVNRRDRFLTNDVAKATFKSVLRCV